jgi:hypothetical protein
MPHYVNIAWGFIFWRVFLVAGLGRLFDFLFLPIKNQLIEPRRAHEHH